METLNQNDIKGKFWNQDQISVHPTVIFWKIDKVEKPKRIVITHLSDIISHSAQMVYFITKDCIEKLLDMFPDTPITKMYLWSDGCASQYKGKTSFFYLDQFEVNIERNFFGSEHGKGESDAETGTISRLYTNTVRAHETIILNESDLRDYLDKKKIKIMTRLIMKKNA